MYHYTPCNFNFMQNQFQYNLIFLATSTRNKSFTNLSERSLNKNQILIFNTIKAKKDLTNSEISNITKLPINIVTGRNFELRKMGKVTPFQKRKCQISGKIVQSWCVND